MYSDAVATGVAQQKTSRTAKVLLAAVRPRHMLTDKILGIGACGQPGDRRNRRADRQRVRVQRADSLQDLAAAARELLWFAFGYALYSFGFEVAGALAAR